MTDQADNLRKLAQRMLPQLQPDCARYGQVILWVGSAPRVGTTTLALHAGIALARQQLPVTLVDAHPTRGELTGRLGGHRYPGLAEAIRGDREIHEVRQTGVSGTGLITNPSDGLSALVATSSDARRLASCMSQLAANQLVLIDVGDGPNAVLHALTAVADRIVLVLTPHTDARLRAYQLIKSLGGSGTEARFAVVVNRPQRLPHPDHTFRLLALACNRFLNLHLDLLGSVDHDQDLATGVPQARRVTVSARWAPLMARTVATFVHHFVGRAPRRLQVAATEGANQAR